MVAESDRATGSDEGSTAGNDNAAGRANSFEFRSKFAAGERRTAVIAAEPDQLMRS